MRLRKLYPIIFSTSFVSIFSMQAYSQNSNKSFDVDYSIQLKDFNKGARDILVNTYFKEVLDSKRKAYDWREKSQEISADEIIGLSMRVDTFYIESPEPPYDLKMRTIEGAKDPLNAITEVYVKEKWTVGNDGTIQKKIVGVSPAIGHKYLCWIEL